MGISETGREQTSWGTTSDDNIIEGRRCSEMRDSQTQKNQEAEEEESLVKRELFLVGGFNIIGQRQVPT